jgi:nitrate reductase gamma subunit
MNTGGNAVDIWLSWVEGPLFWLAFAVFLIGGLWRIIGVLRAGVREDISPPAASPAWGFVKGVFRHFVPRAVFAKRTWVHLLGGYAFHVGLLVLLLAAAPHMAFIQKHFGALPWPALPRWAFIVVAEVAFAGLILLWVRRISDPVMRLISDADDHFGTILTFLVMLTGCMALEQAHGVLRAVHMSLADIWLFVIPFTRLAHTFTFWLSRGFTGATYGRRGIVP